MSKKLTRPQLDELARKLIKDWKADLDKPDNPFGSREPTAIRDLVGSLARGPRLTHPTHRSLKSKPRYRLVHDANGTAVFWVDGGGYEIVFANLRFARVVQKILESDSRFGGTRLVRDVE